MLFFTRKNCRLDKHVFSSLALFCAGVVGTIPAVTWAQSSRYRPLLPVSSPKNPPRGVSPASPYSDPVVRLSTNSLRTFDTALGELARQANVSIVAEGRPFRSFLDKDATKALAQALSLPTSPTSSKVVKAIPLSKAISQIAAAYDYRVEGDDSSRNVSHGALSPVTVFVLHKRYTDRNDFPDVPLDEALYSLRSMGRSFEALNLEPSDGDRVSPPIRFMLSLSEEQRKAAAGGEGIPLSAVDPSLRQMMIGWSVANNLGFSFATVAKTASQLEITRSRRSVYRYMDLMGTGITVFGFEGPLGLNGILLQFGLSHGIRPQLLNWSNDIFSPDRAHDVISSWITAVPANDSLKTMSSQDKEATENSRKLISALEVNGTLPDPDKPQAGAQVRAEPPPAAATTLAKSIRSLNAAPKEASKRGAPLAQVDPILGDKSICLFNLGRLTKRQAMQAMANAYGASVVEQADGNLLLTLRAAPQVRAYTDLPAVLQTLLPLPWTEFAQGCVRRAQTRVDAEVAADPSFQAPARIGSGDPFQAQAQTMRMQSIQRQALTAEERASHEAIVRRLRVVVEPQLAATPDARLPMAASGAEADRLLALLYVCDNLEQYRSLKENARAGGDKAQVLDVANRKEWYVQGAIDFPKKSVRLSLSSLDTKGNQHLEVSGIFASDAVGSASSH